MTRIGYIIYGHRMFIFLKGRESTMDRDEFLKVLEDSFTAYYNVIHEDSIGDLPLAFRADYFSRAEKYWLSKKITVWANETNEFAYIFSNDRFDKDMVDMCVDYALKEGLPRVKPHKEHQYTNIKVIFVADSFAEDTVKYIQAKKFSKNYKFSLHGFTELKTAAVDLPAQKAYTNRAAHELTDYFRKLFAAVNKK